MPGRIFRRWIDRWELRRRAEEELALHYEEALEARLGRGLSHGEARLEAARQVGDRRAAVEACLAVWDDGPAAAPRLLLFPAGSGPVPGVPFSLPEAVVGDWYLSSQVPTSPIAPASSIAI